MLDVHTHFLPLLEPPDSRSVEQGWPVLTDRGTHVEVMQHGELVRRITASAWDARVRLAEMDRFGVTRQVVMPTPFTFLYDASIDVTVQYAHAQNRALAELVADDASRFFGLGSLPLQDPDAALEEVAHVADLPGLYGVEIGTHAHSLQLHEQALDPVFAELAARGMAVFVHPWRPVAPERSAHHGLAFGLGRPVETDLAVGSLVFGGVLDRHPRLRVCLAHGGAGIPAIRGRLTNGWNRQEPSSRTPRRPPRQVLARMWADGLTYDPAVLALAEETFGAEHMVVGSDYPFAAQEPFPGASYAEAHNCGVLSMGSDWRTTTCTNALKFLDLEPAQITHPPHPDPGT